MAKLNIYHLFVIALVLISSRCQIIIIIIIIIIMIKQNKKVAGGVFGFDFYLLIEQLAVLPQIKIICHC